MAQSERNRTMYLKPSDLRGELRAAVIDLLYCLADDEIVIGHRNSEWTGLGPILEADIAFSSMAQDEMGHALAFYRLLHELGEADPDTLAFARKPEQYHCASLVALGKGDWAFSLVRQYLYDAAESLRLDALATSAYEPLAIVARKLHGEEKYHLMHGRTWLARLGSATGESRERMQAAVDKAWPHALGLFEATRWDGALAEAGIAPREEDLCRDWREHVLPNLSAAGLTPPRDARPVLGGRVGRHPPELAELLDAMTKVYRLDPRGDLVTMMTTQTHESDLARAWRAIETVVDPEIPAVSVVEMGMIPDVSVVDDAVTVELSPTFAGCPAIDVIRGRIMEAVLDAGFQRVEVRPVFDPPWTTDRITPAGLRKLKEFGLALPGRCDGTPVSEAMLSHVACPYCNSIDTTLESIFGPTLCRAIHYCNACRQSFEQIKPL